MVRVDFMDRLRFVSACALTIRGDFTTGTVPLQCSGVIGFGTKKFPSSPKIAGLRNRSPAEFTKISVIFALKQRPRKNRMRLFSHIVMANTDSPDETP